MKNKAYLLISLGAILVMGAAIMLFYNYRLESEAQIAADKIIPKLIKEIDNNEINHNKDIGVQKGTVVENTSSSVPKATPSSDIKVDNHQYIGILTIPSLGLKLPVLSSYRYADLKIAPCKYAGDISDKLVIAGHNYRTHFGRIHTLSKGETLTFTDTKGEVFKYRVELIEELGSTEIEQMVDSKWDLTLFTCNYAGDKRVTVRCNKVK